jgi:hypothetical protein
MKRWKMLFDDTNGRNLYHPNFSHGSNELVMQLECQLQLDWLLEEQPLLPSGQWPL